MDLTIYKHNLKNMSEKEFAQESHRISAIRKNDMAYAEKLNSAWMNELDARHPIQFVKMPV